jgi:WD40 repeat protein/DNA-directed RNA polymerase specialized sigma24 family protein
MINFMKPSYRYPQADMEAEYALWLSNADPGDTGMVEVLIERYAAHIHCLAQAVLSGSSNGPASDDELRSILQTTFRQAANNLATFRGQESVRSWLYSLAIQTIRKVHHPKRQKTNKVEDGPDGSVTWLWRAIDRLSPELQLSLMLRYGHGFSLAEIRATFNQVQGRKHKEAHRLLMEARQRLSEEMPAQKENTAPVKDHKEWRSQLQAALDGILDNDRRALEALRDHLGECSDCRRRQEQLTQLEELLRQAFTQRWKAPDLDSEQWKAYVLENYHSSRPQKRIDTKMGAQPEVIGALRQSAKSIFRGEALWLGFTLLALAVVAWFFIQQDTHTGKPLFEAAPVTPTPILPATTSLVRSLPSNFNNSHEQLLPYEGRLSADGHWLAFSVYHDSLVYGQATFSRQVMLLDLEHRQMISVSPIKNTSEYDPSNMWDSNMPAISGDGQLVVYTSNAPLPGNERANCSYGGQPVYCYQIYLYNRQTGVTERLSETSSGEPANGHSVAPALSADGRWVAFWSNATNLAKMVPPFCSYGEESGSTRCSDLYLYDRQTKRMLRVGLGRQGDLNLIYGMFQPELISISADGRYLGLTVYIDDMLARTLGVHHRSEVFVYDRISGSFEPVNLSSDGTPGNGVSINPSLSPDGRFVAFASLADNLVPGDSNKKADVFLRDRQTSRTTIVSIASDGAPGNNDSGVFLGILYRGQSSIAVSEDGEQVIFLSSADNLDIKAHFRCSTQGWFPCSQVYLHDISKGETHTLGTTVGGLTFNVVTAAGETVSGETVSGGTVSGETVSGETHAIVAQQQLNSLYLSPELSADGHTAIFLQQDLECPRGPMCSIFLIEELPGGHLRQAFNVDQLIANVPTSISTPISATLTGLWAPPAIIADATGRLVSLAFSPDGSRLAGGAEDGSLTIWQLENSNRVQQFYNHNLSVNSVAFSPDGSILASGGSDGYVSLYGFPSGLKQISLGGFKSPILSLAFSPNGKILTVGSVGRGWSWDMQDHTFPILDYYEYPGLQVNRVAYSPDGSLLAHALSDGSVWLRRASDGAVVARLGGHQQSVLSLAFSSDDHWLASGSADGRVNLWSITKRPDQKLKNWIPFRADPPSDWVIENRLSLIHKDWVTDLSFTPYQNILTTASLASGTYFWQIPSGDRLESPLGTLWDQALSLAFSPNGRMLAIASAWGGVRLWQLPESSFPGKP